MMAKGRFLGEKQDLLEHTTRIALELVLAINCKTSFWVARPAA